MKFTEAIINIEEQKDDSGSVPLPFGKQTVVRSLFVRQDIVLHSGQKSDFKIECDALTDDDWECLAYLISKQVKFDSVRGVPNGGNKLEKALEKYQTNTWQTIVLIVDDVLTTGKSMEDMKANLLRDNPEHYKDVWFKGFVIFARGECPNWVKSVFKIGDCL